MQLVAQARGAVSYVTAGFHRLLKKGELRVWKDRAGLGRHNPYIWEFHLVCEGTPEKPCVLNNILLPIFNLNCD